MGSFVLALLKGIGWLLGRVLFIFKIVFSYFVKCAQDVAGAIVEEWKEREIDSERY